MLTIFLIPLVHELGHWLAARFFGSRLRFYREGFRFLWKWPDVSRAKLRIICHAGFALEFALIPLMPWQYQVAAVLHFVAYPFYAGEASDFRGVI